jgi:hypothetical protein
MERLVLSLQRKRRVSQTVVTLVCGKRDMGLRPSLLTVLGRRAA